MFAVRGVAVSFSIFFIFYSVLSLAVGLVWRRVWDYYRLGSARSCADALFVLRMIPWLVSAVVTLAFVVPSFLLLEPRAVRESMSPVLVVLCICGMAVMLAGAWNAGGLAAGYENSCAVVERSKRNWPERCGFRAAGFAAADCESCPSADRGRYSAAQRVAIGSGGVCAHGAGIAERAAA